MHTSNAKFRVAIAEYDSPFPAMWQFDVIGMKKVSRRVDGLAGWKTRGEIRDSVGEDSVEKRR